ncbi:MAG: helix-turn-helix domain-containing protein [Xanthobacteraceae bacterium]|nr:helix-turn-helix domain-containing protein [Xanthobacteraceae bacterium]
MTAPDSPAPSAPDPVLNLRFSTDAFVVSERIEAWRDLFGHTICQADIEPVGDVPFHSDVVLRALPGLGMASGICSGARYWRPAHLVADDDLIFVVNHIGTDLANMLGRETIVQSGEAVLVTTGAIGGVINKAATRFTTIRVLRAAIAPALADVHEAMVKPVAAGNTALRYLLDYISVLEDTDALVTAEQQRLVVSNVHDLIALAAGATNETIAVAKHRGLAAARLRAIKADIRGRIGASAIDAAALAARHDVTPRYVQMLFEREGTTLSEFMLLQRLAAAHRMLCDPAQDHRRIADIALAVGFGDISYFNRMVRRHFGRTPSDVRNNSDAPRGG